MTTNYTGVDGGSFTNIITGPSAGEFVTAASVGLIAQGAANLSKRLFNVKANLSGAAFTGAVTATNATNDPGLDATGSTTAPGVRGIGGGTNGTGVIGVGGASDGAGVQGNGTGAGSGVVAVGGSTGWGLSCTGGSSSVPALRVHTGNAIFTGTSPSLSADPGADNFLCGANVCKAWGMLSVASGTATVNDGFNIASAAVVSTTHVLVTLARGFSSPTYSVFLQNNRNADENPRSDFGSNTNTTFRIYWVDFAGAAIDPSTATLRTSIQVMGRQ